MKSTWRRDPVPRPLQGLSCRPRLAAAVLALACASRTLSAAGPAFDVEGVVHRRDGRPLTGVSVSVESLGMNVRTGSDGRFRLELPAGQWTAHLACAGWTPLDARVTVVDRPLRLDYVLEPVPRLTQEVVVRALRADEDGPATTTALGRLDVARLDHGQEMPFLLGSTPAVTFQSDSGLGAGYSYFALRGISQTRINMTFDGVPLNDPEDAGVYFSNFGGFAGALDSIQIERGVTTSTVGAAAYGGAVSFVSVVPGDHPQAEAEAAAGSFGSQRASAAVHSGRRACAAVWTRGSVLETDGYRSHSGVRQRSVFAGGNCATSRSVVAFSGFSGREDTELSFLATERAVLEAQPRLNPLEAEALDHFGQDLFQVQWVRRVGGSGTFMTQAYYNKVKGWYRLWDAPSEPRSLLEYGVDGAARGGRSSLLAHRGPLSITLGLHAAAFDRDHTLDARSTRLYRNTGHKGEGNGFLKLAYQPSRWRVDFEAQVRHARFDYDGDVAIQGVRWTFLNARVGVRRVLTPGVSLHATAGRVTREPARNDLFAGEDNPSSRYDLRAVHPERAFSVEMGGNWRTSRLESRLSAYVMDFRDEIALTGELSAIGLPLRTNVGRSSRVGMEVEALWRWLPRLRVRLAGHLGRGRIGEWRQVYGVFDRAGRPSGQEAVVHRDVEPLLSPAVTAHSEIEWDLAREASASLSTRYSSGAFLDNTNRADLTTPPVVDVGATLRVGLARWVRHGQPRLTVVVANLLDRRLWPAGYSNLRLVEGTEGRSRIEGTAYYFPLATRTVTASLSVRWGG